MGTWGRRRRLTPEETAANAERKRLRDLAAMECQVCGRRILANTGLVAHHGYERPWNEPGYQTSSCYGARHLPYEADGRVLAEYIDIMEAQLTCLKTARKHVFTGATPVRLTFRNDWRDKENVTYSVKAENFAEIRAKHETAFIRMGFNSFETILARDLAERDGRIKTLSDHIKAQQSRLARWKLTHAFNETAGLWEKI